MNNNQEFKSLLENIIGSYEVRLVIIKEIVANTQKTLEEFRTKREEMSARLGEALSHSVNLRKKDFDGMIGEILNVQTEKEDNIKKMLTEFRQEEEDVLTKLKSLLDKQGDNLKIKNFKKTLGKIKEEQEKRSKNISQGVGSEIEKLRQELDEMLTHFKKERDEMALEWQNVVNKMAQNNH